MDGCLFDTYHACLDALRQGDWSVHAPVRHPDASLYRHTSGVSDIGEHMQISAAAASQLVDKLVQSGLLDRIEDINDRRARLLSLSPKGRALIVGVDTRPCGASGIGERSCWVDEVVAAAMLALTRAASRLDVSVKNFDK